MMSFIIAMITVSTGGAKWKPISFQIVDTCPLTRPRVDTLLVS